MISSVEFLKYHYIILYLFFSWLFLCSLHVSIFLFLLSCWWLILKQNLFVTIFLTTLFLRSYKRLGVVEVEGLDLELLLENANDAQFQIIRTAARTPSFWRFSWSNFKATGCGCRETKILRIAGNVDWIWSLPNIWIDRWTNGRMDG